MTCVLDIVKEYLKANGYDGLWSFNDDCACTLDDFEPCGQISSECEAGYRVDYDKDDSCGCDLQGENHFHIQPTREKNQENDNG